MTRQFLIIGVIGLFGAFGAVSRYAVGVTVFRWLGEGFAYGTLVVNVLGCFLLALLAHLGTTTDLVSPELRLVLGVGFLGAFTTFSTFGYETLTYLEDGDWVLAAANVVANLVFGLVAVWAGLTLARYVYGGA